MSSFKKTLIFYLTVTMMASITSAQNNQLRSFLKRVLDSCARKPEILKCLKIETLKMVDRAVRANTVPLADGVTLVGERGRIVDPLLNETKLEKLKSEEIDDLLLDGTSKFLDGHKSLRIRIPRLAAGVEEARKKKGGGGGGGGALMWALAIKGSFLAMAYNGIAVMAGTALIVGKMALLLSAILGLKKLVRAEHHDKTTIEIVKTPKRSESHTHSTSYEDEGYRRSGDGYYPGRAFLKMM